MAVSASATYLGLLPWLVVLSVGQGITYTTMFTSAAAGVAPEEQGIASGALAIFAIAADIAITILVALTCER